MLWLSTPQFSCWPLLARDVLLPMTNPTAVTDCLASSGPWAQHSPSGRGFMSSLARSSEQVHGWHPGEEIKRSRHCHPEIPPCMRSGQGDWLTFHLLPSSCAPCSLGAPGSHSFQIWGLSIPSCSQHTSVFFPPRGCLMFTLGPQRSWGTDGEFLFHRTDAITGLGQLSLL